MRLTLRHDLAFVTATLTYGDVVVEIPNVLVDTGAASTIINADLAADAGVFLSPTDTLRRLRGVGGHEHVFARRVDHFAIGAHGLDNFELDRRDRLRVSVRRGPRHGLLASRWCGHRPRSSHD